jgi:ABC-type multidrug transport system permease subunit
MQFALTTAKKDIVRRLRDPLGLIIWMGLPLLIVGILMLVFGRGGGAPRGLLLLADEDGSFVSTVVGGAFTQGPLAEMVAVERVEQAAGRARMERGDASALLVVPEGFGQAVLRNEPAKLTLVVNPSQRILPGILEQSLILLAEGAFYLQEMAAEPLQELNQIIAESRAPSDDVVARISVLFSRTFRQLQGLVNNPLIELETNVVATERPAMNFAAAFFPAMLFMALLFSSQGLSEDIWIERRLGTLRRIAVAPRSLLSVLAGKALAATAVIAAIVTVAFLAGTLFGMAANNALLAAVWVTLTGTALYLMMLTIQLFATAQRTGNVLTTIVVFPLALVGGSFFPFEFMPQGLAAIGRRTPNGWSLTVLKTIMDGTAPLVDLVLPALMLAAWLAVFFLAASWRLKAVAARP